MTTDDQPTTHGDATEPAPVVLPPPPKKRQWPLPAILTIAAMGAVLAFLLGLLLGDDDGADVTTLGASSATSATGVATEEETAAEDGSATGSGPADEEDEDETPTAEESDGETGADASTTAQEEPSESAEEASGSAPAEDEAEPAATAAALDPDGEPWRSVVVDDGTFFLRGRVPSEDVGEELAAPLIDAVGEETVAVEWEVDPDAPAQAPTPVSFEDEVLFDQGEIRIKEEFVGLLDLGVSVLTAIPDLRMTVIGHTDTAGSAAVNQTLSQARVDAVIDYYTERGVDADRLTGIARGESEPVNNDGDAAGRAANRRVEFIVESGAE